MTKEQIAAVLEEIRTWPRERQEDAARLLITMEAQGSDFYRLSEEERRDLEDALAEVASGSVASDEEVASVFARHRA